jgi:hypothetical protein
MKEKKCKSKMSWTEHFDEEEDGCQPLTAVGKEVA